MQEIKEALKSILTNKDNQSMNKKHLTNQGGKKLIAQDNISKVVTKKKLIQINKKRKQNKT